MLILKIEVHRVCIWTVDWINEWLPWKFSEDGEGYGGGTSGFSPFCWGGWSQNCTSLSKNGSRVGLDWSVLSSEDPSWPWPTLMQGGGTPSEAVHQWGWAPLMGWESVGSHSRPLLCEHTHTHWQPPLHTHTHTHAHNPHPLKQPIITSCPRLLSLQNTELMGYKKVRAKKWPPSYYGYSSAS